MIRRQRWYEKNPVISEAMNTWEAFPRPLQVVIAKKIKKLIGNQTVELKYNSPLTFLFRFTPSNITSFVKSNQRRRWYDQENTVRSVVNTLSRADHNDFVDVSQRIIRVETYFKTKKIVPTTLDEKQLTEAVNFVFEHPEAKFF